MPLVDVGDAELFYAEYGAGDPLVLVHGGFLDHTLWAFTAPAFAKSWRVIALDLPGHGRSTGKLDQSFDVDTAIATMVDHLERFVEGLGTPAHFAAQSAGGCFVLHLAARRPDLVRSMSLHEPSAIALLDDEFHAERGLQTHAARLLARGETDKGLAAFLQSVGGDWTRLPDQAKDIFRGNAHVVAGTKFFEDPARATPLPRGLDGIMCPTLLTKGTDSPKFMSVSVDRIAERLSHADVKTIDGAGHAPMLHRPIDYAGLVAAFIKQGHEQSGEVGSHRA